MTNEVFNGQISLTANVPILLSKAIEIAMKAKFAAMSIAEKMPSSWLFPEVVFSNDTDAKLYKEINYAPNYTNATGTNLTDDVLLTSFKFADGTFADVNAATTVIMSDKDAVISVRAIQ